MTGSAQPCEPCCAATGGTRQELAALAKLTCTCPDSAPCMSVLCTARRTAADI